MDKINTSTTITEEPSYPNHKDAKDLVRGALVNYLGMLAKTSKVLFIFVAARFYGANAIGLYFLAWSTIDIASKFGLWGMDRSLIRDIARYNADRSVQTKAKLFGILRFNISITFCLSLLVTGALMIMSPMIAEGIFKDENLLVPLRLLALALPFVVLTHAFIAPTKALRIMRYEALIRHGLEPLILLLGTLLLIPFKLGAIGLVTAHIFASLVAVSTAAFVLFRKYRYLGWQTEPLSREIKKETIRYTSPIAAMDVLNLMVARIDILLVGALLNSTSAGFYGIVVEIISVIKRVSQGFGPIFAPIVSELFHNKQKERLQRNYVIVTRWLMTGTLLPVLALVLFPNQILLLFNIKSSEAVLALIVLALAHGLLGTFSAAEGLLIMTGKTLLNTLLAGVMLAVNCAVGVFLIPKIGLVGAAIGTMTAFVFVSGARIFQGYRQLQLHPFSYSLLWPLTTAAITLILFFFLNQWLIVDSLAKTIAVFFMMTIFYTTIYFLGAKEPEEKHIISKLKNKLKWRPAIMRI
ncbi:MAG: lipopolysaccharide biosynthesis protein [bacterium]